MTRPTGMGVLRQLVFRRIPSVIGLILAFALLVLAGYPIRAQDAATDAYSAMEKALQAHIQALKLPYDGVFTARSATDTWGVGNAEYIFRDTGDPVPSGYFMVLARRFPDGGWRALVPSAESATEYNSWLADIPVELIGVEGKKFLHVPEPGSSSPVAPVAGYRLPWAGGWGATLTQGPFGGGSHAGIWAWDFNLWQGQWDGTRYSPGHVVASKAGVVVFAKDVATDDHHCDNLSCAGWANVVIIKHSESEYSWYYHLQHDSIPEEVMQARQDAITIEAGTVIGIEGQSGYSTAVHLHFMVSDGVPDLSQYDENDADRAPWPTQNNTLEVDFEDWDEQQTEPYSGNYLDPANAVILYWDADYKGPAIRFAEGNLNFGQCSPTGDDQRFCVIPTFLDNKISSIRVTPQGELFVKFNQDRNGGGCTRGWWWTEANFDNDTYDADTFGCLMTSLNDSISSVHFDCHPCDEGGQISGNAETPALMIADPDSDPPPLCGGGPPPPSTDNATFVADITIPDGSVVTPGQALHKVWRVRNTGTSTWGSGYQLAFVGGDQMGAPAAVDVPVAAPGAEVDIPVDMTAPGAQGSYAGYWQLRNAQGTYFGPRLWVEITVQSASSYITILSADPPSPSNATMVRIHTRAEGMSNFRAMRLKVDGQVVYELGAPEFYYDWNTAGYAAGDHSLVVESADESDTSWSHPERRAMSYTLFENTQPINHRPNPPSPTSPNDWNVYYSGNTAQLCALYNGDPDGDAFGGYCFDVYDSAQLWNSGWVDSNCVTTGALGPYNYQWRVKVRDSHGAESDWSDTWHFTLVNPDLAITEFYFEPLDPDSEQVKIRACTAGQAGIGITMRVSVNDASDGSDSGQWHIIKELGVHCFNDEDAPVWRTLDYGDGPHRVRVEAHGVNTGWEGAAVQERTYTLPHRRPASPQLLRPVVASDFGRTSWLNSRTVGFAWQDTLRANQYRLCASLDSDACLNPILDVPLDGSTTQYTHTFDQDYWPLHWRIDASNDRGSTRSGTAHMGIDRTSPACAVQALPPVVYESVFQVSWSGSDDASGVASFDVEYMDSERGTWSEWLGGVPASRSYELFTGQPGHTYAFRCRATDNANNTSLYPEDSDTSTTVDPASRPPTPWWNNDYGQKRNVVILNNMSDATLPAGYPVLLRFDSSTSPSAAEIYNASLSGPKCNDLRIVYNDTTELDRAVQACSETKIEVWFRTSVSIPPGSSNPSSHQLYYGHAGAGSPPGSIATVFYPAVDSNTRVMLYSQEGSGQVVYDSSGYGNNCTFASDLLGWTTGKFGAHAVLFPGDPPDGPALNCGNNGLDLSAFTIEMFFKRNSLQPGIDWLAGQREAGAPAKYVFWLYGHQPQLEVWPCPGCTSSTATSNRQLADLERHHVAVSFDGNNQVRFYIDGVLDSVRTLNFGGWTSSSAHLQIGSGDILRRFSGDISFFRLSNNVRTDFSYGTFVSIKNEPTTAAGEVVQPPEAGAADLALADMTAYPNPMGGALVQAVVANQGDRATQNGFYTDLYVDNQPTGPDDFTGSIRFWVNDPIQPGATVTLTTVLTDVVGLAGRTQTEPLGESTVTLYSQTDSEGLVGEPDDQNNISSGLAVCVASPDQYEEDNTAAAAKWIEMDSAQSHNFDRLADQDWLRFGAQAGKTYILSTSELGAAGDTYLYLYDTDQTALLAANDDYGGSLASRIEWTAPASGTYFVLVKHWNSNVGGCGTIYDVTLSVAVPNTLFLPLVTKNLCPAPSVLPDYPIGDINHDCSVGLADLLFVTSSMDSECGDPAYDSKADLNADCVIDALDIAILQEHWGEICLQYPIGDINRDCSVNAVDWAYLTSHVNANWGDPGYDSSCDLNRDCTIDELDMEIMQEHWGETCP